MLKEKKRRIDIAVHNGRNRLVLHIDDKYTTMTLLKILGGSGLIVFFNLVAIFASMDSRARGVVIFAMIFISTMIFFASLTDVFTLYHVRHVDIDMTRGTMTITDDYGYRKSTRCYDPRDVDEVTYNHRYHKGHEYGNVSLTLAQGKSIVIARIGRLDCFDIMEIKECLEPMFLEKTIDIQLRHELAHVEAFERTLRQYGAFHHTIITFVVLYVAFTMLPLYEPIGTSLAGGVMTSAATFLGVAASLLGAFSCVGGSTVLVKDAVSKADLKEYILKLRKLSNYGLVIVFFVMIFGFFAMSWYFDVWNVTTGAFRDFLARTYWTGCPLMVGPFSTLTTILAVLFWTDHNGRFKQELKWCV